MKTICTEQGTTEWLQARDGCITASAIGKVLQRPDTKGYKAFMLDIVLALEGAPLFAPEPGDAGYPRHFDEAKLYEDDARCWYQFHRGIEVEQTGLVAHDDHDWLRCSPDGLIGDDGLIEIKYRLRLKTYKAAIGAKMPTRDFNQIQCQLLVTGRTWCDYVNYWRDRDNDEWEKGNIRRVGRDSARIAYIEDRANDFWKKAWRLLKERSSSNGKIPVDVY